MWNVQSAPASRILLLWANIIHLVSNCHIDLYGSPEHDPGIPLPKAATTAPLQRLQLLHRDPNSIPGNLLGS